MALLVLILISAVLAENICTIENPVPCGFDGLLLCRVLSRYFGADVSGSRMLLQRGYEF
mgnify:CR=1 FL=1